MTNLSELLPSGGGAKEFSAVASGTLANGQTVALKSDGKVEAVGITSYSESMGAKTAYNTAGEIHQQIYSSCYDSVNDKFVVFWRDSVGSPNKGYASVGSVSGTSISFGTAVEINSTQTYNTTCVYDVSQGKIIFIYYINGDQVYGKVGEVSGTSIINLGTQTVLGSINNSYDRIGAIYNPTEQATFIFCKDANTSSGYLVGLVFTVSGTTITTGTKTTIESNVASTRYPSVAFDSTNNKLVTGYKDWNTAYAVSRVITIVGGSTRSISVGNQATAINGTIDGTATVFDPVQQRIVIIGTNQSASNRLYYANGTVSGTSITFATAGLASSFNSVTFADSGSAVYDAASGNIAVIYKTSSVVYYTIGVVNTANPDTSAFNTPVPFNRSPAGLIEWTSMAVGINGQVGCFYWDKSSDDDGAGSVLTIAHSSSNASSLIGITSEAIANTATGKVNPQGGVATSSTPGAGSASASTQYDATGVEYNGIAYDTNANRFLIAFADVSNSNYGTAVVGNISGGTLSYGSPEVFENTGIQTPMLAFDSNANKVAIFYRNSSGYGSARVATIDPSNDTVTFGTVKIFTTSNISMQDNTSSAVFVPSTPTTAAANKVVVGFMDSSNSQIGKAIVGTITGTDIAFPLGGGTTFHNARTAAITLAYDSTAKRICIGYKDRDDGNKGKALVATVSGTGLSFGADAIFEDGIASKTGSAFDPDTNKVIISYQDNGDNNYAKAVVGTIASTSISFGTPATVLEATSNETSVVYDTNLKKVVVSVDDGGGTRGIAFTGTVSGTDISFDSGVVFETNQISWLNSAFDPDNNKVAIVYDISAGKGVVLSPAGAPSNLVTGSTYYVQNDGTLTTTSSTVTAGKAISTTQLVLKGAS